MLKFWIQTYWKCNRPQLGNFCENPLRWRGPIFFVVKKVDNRTTVDTETFYPVLTQICVTTHIMIKFTQNSDLSDLKCFENFNWKPQWWRVTVLCLTNSCWWLQLWSSIFNVSLDWFLNLFGVKVLFSSILTVQQVTIREFL